MKQLTLEQKLFLNGFRPDTESHLRIIDPAKCRECELKQCTYICPVNTYRWEDEQVTVHRLRGMRQPRMALPQRRLRRQLPERLAVLIAGHRRRLTSISR